jgi:hypothetical protein
VAYVRFDPGFTRHRKLNALTFEDRWRVIEAVDWCVCSSSDGILMAQDLTAAWSGCDKRKAARIALRLADAGILEARPAKAGGGWKVHDFEDYQLSSEAVSEQRRKAAERQRRYRERVAERKGGKGAPGGAARNARDGKRDASVTPSPRARSTTSPPTGGVGGDVTDAGRAASGSAGAAGAGRGTNGLEPAGSTARAVLETLKAKAGGTA